MRNTFMCFGNQPNTDFNDSLSDQASWIEPLESRLLLSGTHYVVNSLLDVVADDGVVTLREAIEAANTNTAVTADVSAGCVEVKDLITFDSLLVAAGPVSIVMGGMELEIVDGLKIVGPGAGLLIVDADGSSYVLRVYGVGVEVEISGLTVSAGRFNDNVGGINNGAKLTLTDVMVSENSNEGIFNSGELVLVNTAVQNNRGGIGNTGTLTAMASSISNNETREDGAGIWNYLGTVTLTDTTVSGNSIDSYGAYDNDGGGIFNDSGVLTMINCVVEDNHAERNGNGGGIYNTGTGILTLRNTTVAGNGSKYGGGIYNRSSATAMLMNTTVVGNHAMGQFSSGGGISNGGILTLTNSTVVGNWSQDKTGGIGSGSIGQLTLNNSIVALNDAPTSSDISGSYTNHNSLLSVDPGFVRNPVQGGRFEEDDYGDLRLSESSIAINLGDDALAVDGDGVVLATDRDGNARVMDGQVDIGAYEYQGTPSLLRESPSAVVTTLADVVDTLDGEISLREAMLYGVMLDQPVTFDGALSGGTIVLSGRALTTYQSLSIDATSIGGMTIDADDLSMVIHIIGEDTQASLSGLTITGGYSEASGGGIYLQGGELTVTGCSISDNLTRGIVNGGGVLIITNSTVTGNTSRGVVVSGKTTLANTIVSGNQGGGISNTGEMRLINSNVSNNNGIGIYNAYDGVLTVKNTVVSGNTGSGGINNSDGVVTVVNSQITGNSAIQGGGIYNGSGVVTVTNTMIVGNWATVYPGYPGGVVKDYGGGGIFNYEGEVTLTNVTLSNNSTLLIGGGISNYGGVVILNNSIVVLNDAPNSENIYGRFASNNSLVGVDPGFVNNPSAGADGEWGTADDDYGDLQLLNTSLAIDFGDDALAVNSEGISLTEDILGNSRMVHGQIDVGAYEYQGIASPLWEPSSSVVTTFADVVDTTDGVISLREAIVYGGVSGHEVTFDASLSGGVIVLDGRELNINKSTVIDATSIGGMVIDAGGLSRVMFIEGEDIEVSFKGLTLTDGFAAGNGGGIYHSGVSLTLNNSTVLRNQISSVDVSTVGGGIYNDVGNLTLVNTSVLGNQAVGYFGSGGGIYNNRGEVYLLNCIVSGNVVSQTTYGSYTTGGGIDNSKGILTLTNSTVSGNTAQWGGGLEGYNDSVTLNNSIVALNQASDYADDVNPYITKNNSLVGVDPDFVRNPSPGVDGVWGTEDDDYGDLRLLPTSAALDHGDNGLLPVDTYDLDCDGDMQELLPVDLVGNQRVAGDVVDIGAYEGYVARYIVNSLKDVVADDGLVTLREAIEASDSNAAVTGDVVAGSSTDVDAIIFDIVSMSLEAGVAVGQPLSIVLNGGELVITDNLVIMGLGTDVLIIDGDHQSRVLNITGASIQVKIDGMAIIGGSTEGDGGGIRNDASDLRLINMKVYANSAANGGGIANLNHGVMSVVQSTILRNTASNGGGGLYNSNDGVSTLLNVMVLGNTAVNGGGIYNYTGTHFAEVKIVNSVLAGNQAEYGGGIYNDVSMLLTNVTVAGNVAEFEGGGIYNQSVRFDNSIVSLNDAPEYANIKYSARGYNHLVDTDPVFVRNPWPGVDGQWGTADDDYGDLRLRFLSSPAVDGGANEKLPDDVMDLDNDGDIKELLSVDLDGVPRILDDTVDIGAYERARVAVYCDFNGDELVNGNDIDLMIANRNDPAVDTVYDLDSDGDTDGDDVDMLIYDVIGTNYGDANVDGRVSLLDLDILGRNYHSTGVGWGQGDFTGNGSVTMLDLDILGDNWGSGAAMTLLGETPAVEASSSTLQKTSKPTVQDGEVAAWWVMEGTKINQGIAACFMSTPISLASILDGADAESVISLF